MTVAECHDEKSLGWTQGRYDGGSDRDAKVPDGGRHAELLGGTAQNFDGVSEKVRQGLGFIRCFADALLASFVDLFGDDEAIDVEAVATV